jgi:hypothetical protein
MIGGNNGHGLTHVPNDVRCENRLIGADEAVGGEAGDVFRGEDRSNTGYCQRGTRVEEEDARVGMG